MKNKGWLALACLSMALSACSTTNNKVAEGDEYREPSSDRDWGRGGRHGGRWRGEGDLPRGGERVELGQVRLGDEGRGIDGDIIDVKNFSRRSRNVECGLTHLRLKAVNDDAYIAKIEIMYRNGSTDSIDLKDSDDRGGEGRGRPDFGGGSPMGVPGFDQGRGRPSPSGVPTIPGRPGDGRGRPGGPGDDRGDGRGERPRHGDRGRDGVFIEAGQRSEWLDVDDVERERGDRDGRPDGRCIDKIKIYGMSGRRDRRPTRIEVIGYAVGRAGHGGWGGRGRPGMGGNWGGNR